jgi:signal transduction histidine kinase
MSAIASWARKYWLELLWGLFCLANVAVLVRLVDFETVPFHFVWVTLTLVYGYRVWRLGTTLITLAVVCATTGASLGWVVTQGPQGPDELTEVPLMAAMFLAMVWHAERRSAALVQVQQAAKREHDFVRDASHQLKTPITVARGFAQLLFQGDVPAAARSDLNVLLEELDRLAKISEGLLTLAVTQVETLVETTFPIDDVIAAARRRWSATAQRRWRFECTSTAIVNGDRLQLDSVLDALIENALNATSTPDAITVIGRVAQDQVIFEVADSGIGIPEDQLGRVFDRFWTMSSNGTAHRGTGLGLAIVKAIAEAHGGSVGVQSVLGVGTRVEFRLPWYGAAAEQPFTTRRIPKYRLRQRRRREDVARSSSL